MKVTIDVDCTAEETRAFLGLPDITPLQEDMMVHLRGQIEAAAQAMNPEQAMKTIFPSGLRGGAEGLADMQKMFWSALSGATTTDGSSDEI